MNVVVVFTFTHPPVSALAIPPPHIPKAFPLSHHGRNVNASVGEKSIIHFKFMDEIMFLQDGVYCCFFPPSAIAIVENFTSSVWKSDGKTNTRNGIALHYCYIV